MISKRRPVKSHTVRAIGGVLLSGAAVILFIFFLVAWSRDAETADPAPGLLIEYPIPVIDGHPLNIVVEAPGRVWFTMPNANAIGSLVVTSTTDYRFNQYIVPTPNSTPYDLAYDHGRDAIWFTEQSANKLGYLDPATGNIAEYPIDTEGSSPTGIAVDPHGTVWLVEREGNQLAKFDPDGEIFSEFPYPWPGAAFEDIAVASTNRLWITAPGVMYVVRFDPDPGDFYSVPVNRGPGTEPFTALKLVVDEDRDPWVTAPDEDMIGLFDSGTMSLWRWYSLPGTNRGVTGLAHSKVGDLHHLWFTERSTGQVGLLVIDKTGSIVANRRHPLSSTNSMPMALAADANGQVWIAAFGSNLIAEWRSPYSRDVFLPLLNH